MQPDNRRYIFDAPATYRIRVRGRLVESQADGLACLADCTGRIRGEPPTTTLTGTLPDQGGLLCVLTQLCDMGYPLLEVKRLADPKASAPPLRG